MSVIMDPVTLLVLLGVGAVFSLLLWKVRWLAASNAILFSTLGAALVVYWGLSGEMPLSSIWDFEVMEGTHLTVSLNWFSYLFLASVVVMAPLVLLYSWLPMKDRQKERPFYGLFMLSLLGGAGVTLSRDLLTLFLFWEVMSWPVILLIGDGRARSGRAMKTYFAFSMLSAGAILALLALVRWASGGIAFTDAANAVLHGSNWFRIIVLVLGIVAFGTKGAVVPFHIWAPGAYGHTEDPFSAFLSGSLSKTGIFGAFLVLDVFMGTAVLMSYGSINGLTTMGFSVALLGAATALVGGIMAMMQDDAKKLLAYSSISQLGYVFVGLGVGGSTATAGALYHVLNHTIFKTLLFMGLGAVIYRTGEHKLSRMGGMIHVMPATFWCFLVGIFAAAAIPITSGLASKWLIYEGALEKGVGIIVPLLFLPLFLQDTSGRLHGSAEGRVQGREGSSPLDADPDGAPHGGSDSVRLRSGTAHGTDIEIHGGPWYGISRLFHDRTQFGCRDLFRPRGDAGCRGGFPAGGNSVLLQTPGQAHLAQGHIHFRRGTHAQH